MKKRQLIISWLVLVLLAIGVSGCALIGTALTAGIAYGIAQATK
ncbi:MAG: hypothetical protein V1884_04985 [Candidatus Omnitrophota bacterium]